MRTASYEFTSPVKLVKNASYEFTSPEELRRCEIIQQSTLQEVVVD
jgi:hypothetical protein